MTIHSTDDVATPKSILETLAMRGAIWTVAGFGGAQIVRFGLNLALTRLLYPELFGLMALVLTITTGVTLFCDFGATANVVRDPRGDDPAFLNTIWTLQIARGAGVALLCLLLASPLARLYGDVRLGLLIPVVGLGSFVSGFNSTSLLTLQRHLEVRRLVTLEMVVQILAGTVMIVWAWLAPGVWALAGGLLAQALIRLAGSYFINDGPAPRFEWDSAAAAAIFAFGKWIWVATVLMFLASQIDRLILGKLLTLQMLGIYGIAAAIAEMPRSLVYAISANVLFPVYAKSSSQPRDVLRRHILSQRRSLLGVMAGLTVVLAAVGDQLIRVLYDQRYAAGAWMLPMLALGVWPSALALSMEPALSAIGQPRYSAFGNFWKSLFTALGIPLAFAGFGIAGAVVMVALNDLPYYAQIAYGLWRERLSVFGQDAKMTLLLCAILILMMLARQSLGWGLPFQRHT